MLTSEITKENLNKMVIRFYTKILNDNVVGPFFIEKLGDDLNNDTWKPHIILLTNFWASIALGDQNYRGNPLAPHLELEGLRRESFDQWLKLFFETLDSIYEPRTADMFKQRSTIIAGNFMRNLRIA
ncbi:putative globin [Sulfurimonas gotlandica GD1]|uniref:Putative globin n=1 Tax=Sulfurimonas gotlandica (strain DSM 19862 / JCM 16533 / GD1) TaxID=929558 RepID=B6BLP9_SULGG|nr:group III truncated hemoglobin [Sulfurimonas gotlandica]EDZ61987.1 sec-independent protein translocase protein tatc [Sulfurimonas gotlandica GD1]EHP28708.1 putative globin [Sulfurimonas gotlandica GD1]